MGFAPSFGKKMKRLTFFALVALAGCSSGSTASKGSAAVETTEAGVVDPACYTQDTASLRDEPPSGSCTANAVCEFHTPPGECKPGALWTASSPTSWHCDCVKGSWSCSVIGGGFSLEPCPDAGTGTPESGDASTDDASGAD